MSQVKEIIQGAGEVTDETEESRLEVGWLNNEEFGGVMEEMMEEFEEEYSKAFRSVEKR